MTKIPAKSNVNISAIGTAIHTPVMPNISGRISRHIVISPKVRKKEITADIVPLDKAVNAAETNILIPLNKKLIEKI